MKDQHGREINYLRISITDRCNLRCQYCMPLEGTGSINHSEILSLEEIARLAKISASLGIRKVRFTGGEPLVRRNFVQLMRYISEIPEIDDIAITTNGMLFSEQGWELKQAGLKRVNFSLDSLQSDRYRYITRYGDLKKVQKAVFDALEMELNPVKLNMVVIKDFNDDEVLEFANLAYYYPLHVRFIEFMPIGDIGFWGKEKVLSESIIKERIEMEYELLPGSQRDVNGPARQYKINGGLGSVGFIGPLTNHFCHQCNRIRLTADGKLRACLYHRTEIDLKKPMRDGASDEELAVFLQQGISMKPARHHMNEGWGEENRRKMFQIGG